MLHVGKGSAWVSPTVKAGAGSPWHGHEFSRNSPQSLLLPHEQKRSRRPRETSAAVAPWSCWTTWRTHGSWGRRTSRGGCGRTPGRQRTTRTRTTTRRTRSATYGSAHGEEDTAGTDCKSLPVPAFVSETPRHQGVSSLLLSSRPPIRTTPVPRAF